MSKQRYVPEETAIHLGNHLVKEGLINQTMLDVSLAELTVTGDRLGPILVRNGFISMESLVNVIHDVDLDQLSNQQAIITRVPPEILLETRTIIMAEAPGTIHLASLSPEIIVTSLLRRYYEDEEFYFHPVSMDLLDDYLQKIEKIASNKGTITDKIMQQALRDGITDVHISPRASSYSVFSRHLGILKHTHEGDLEEYATLVAQIKDRSRIDLAERRVPQDGAFQVENNGRLVDMRVATAPTIYGEKVVIRLLDPDRIQPDLKKLGITRSQKWLSAISNKHGICLICGPTGSGKTTTLNATVREMDRFGKCINTLEDPVEYRIPYVTQVNINHTVGLDFSRGVRAMMRMDPETIIAGEIRDLETAQNAMKAAETGHLVLGTLHTGSIRGTVDRLRDIGVNVSDLRYLLRGVLVQSLIRTFCPSCHGKGCSKCLNTGFSGRSVISECEYFKSPAEVDRMIAGEVWWPSMIEDAVDKMEQGLTSAQEVVRVFGEEGREMLSVRGHNTEGLIINA